jgi:hypothetical protein
MRDVVSVGFADNFVVDSAGGRLPASGFENSRAFDGRHCCARQPDHSRAANPAARPELRNVIYVEADRIDRAIPAAGVIAAAGPSSVIRDLQVAPPRRSHGHHTAGTGPLVTTNVEESKDGPARLSTLISPT